MKLSQHQRAFARDVARLIGWAYARGYELTFGQAERTPEQQAIYIKQGKSKTPNSLHLKRLAVDFNLFWRGEYQASSAAHQPLGNYWESLAPENQWGGRWGWDGNHYERKPGHRNAVYQEGAAA